MSRSPDQPVACRLADSAPAHRPILLCGACGLPSWQGGHAESGGGMLVEYISPSEVCLEICRGLRAAMGCAAHAHVLG